MGPADPILGVTQSFLADGSPRKINLGVGAYRDERGRPFVLPSVAEAERRLAEAAANHEYGPIGGPQKFTELVAGLLLGEGGKQAPRVTVQTLSGTGALRVAGEYMKRWLPQGTKLYLPDPTWANHIPCFEDSGFELGKYRYYDGENIALDLDGMCQDIERTPKGSVIVLHACAHNPTGVDPSRDDWKSISKVLKDRVVLVDCAYQGFASGDPERDVEGLQQLLADGHKPLVCQSLAKNFGLYGERVGALHVMCDSADEAARVDSQLKILIRPMYSNPPIYGAKVVEQILGDEALAQVWREDVSTMASRIIKMREALVQGLAAAGSTRDWSHVTKQIGMFSFTGLTGDQVDKLAANHSVYLTRNGRISIAGITPANVTHLAESMHAVTKD